jgi:hypothetical protein
VAAQHPECIMKTTETVRLDPQVLGGWRHAKLAGVVVGRVKETPGGGRFTYFRGPFNATVATFACDTLEELEQVLAEDGA